MHLRAYILIFIVSINTPPKISPPGPITGPDWRARSVNVHASIPPAPLSRAAQAPQHTSPRRCSSTSHQLHSVRAVPYVRHIDTPAPLTHTHVNRSTEKQYSTAHQTPPSRLIPLGGSAPSLRLCVHSSRARARVRGERTDGRAARRGASGRPPRP